EQPGKKGQRLLVEVALLGLPDRTDQGVGRLRIARVGRPEKVRRSRAEIAGCGESAANQPVEGTAARPADALGDGGLNPRVSGLGAPPAARLVPYHPPR